MRPPPISNARSYAYDDLYGDNPQFIPGELSAAGQRIAQPRRRTGGTVKVGGILLLAGFAGAWAAYGPPTTWPVQCWADWVTAQIAAAAPELDLKVQAPAKPVKSAMVVPSPPAEAPPRDIPPAVELAPTPKGLPEAMATPPPGAEKAAAEPLPPLVVDPADPYQVRAAAVGLHPGLSRVLLARLSEADYRNAGIAIKTALAETPYGRVHVWPRQRTPELAVFKVHFVSGAAQDCRRYVVVIAKDGWTTTADPMERCGAQAGRPRSG